MKLTPDEIKKLNKDEVKEYSGLDEIGKEMFSIAWRESNLKRKSGSGRHKLNCECDKCKLTRAAKENLLNETKTIKDENNINSTKVEKPDTGLSDKTYKENEKANPQTDKKENETGTKTAQEILDEKLNEFSSSENNYQETQNQNPEQNNPEQQIQKPKPEIDISNFISGALFLTALDYIFPSVLKFVLGFFNSKYRRIKETGMKKLYLSETEKQYLEPTAEQVVKYIFADAHPLVIFAVVTGSIYGGKMLQLTEEDFEPVKPKQIIQERKKTR